VTWLSGYDVLSFEIDGREKFVEVKTTIGPARTRFYLTRNEHPVGTANPDIWRIYRVHLFSTAPQIFTLSPPLDAVVDLRPVRIVFTVAPFDSTLERG
jgi:hypothetical protein